MTTDQCPGGTDIDDFIDDDGNDCRGLVAAPTTVLATTLLNQSPMKIKIVSLFVGLLLACPLFANHVSDKANLLSAAQVSQLELNVTGPVFIETTSSVPNDDIKGYGDRRAADLATAEHIDRVFVIAVTTHPRAWRISMYPVGAVGGEATRQIGDVMAAGFRRGDYYGAFLGASRNLTALGNGTPFAAPAAPAPVVNTTKTVTTVVRKPIPVAAPYRDPFIDIGLVVLAGVALVVLIWIICGTIEWFMDRAADRRDREARNTAPDTATAANVWNKYTPAQRQTIVNQYSTSPHYHSGVLNDPLSFYMFMTLMNHNHGGYYGGGGYGGYSQPVSSGYTEERTETTSSSYSAPSSSYSSSDSSGNSGSSYDSGSSSSYDSGSSSSSDSSGSGGSW